MADHDVTVAEALAAVQSADAGADSLIAFAATLKQQVIDLLAHQMTPELQAGLNSIFDVSTAEAKKLADATAAPAV
jgi:hypothetical protein